MYAIVEIAGQQFKVKKDQKVFVHRLSNEEGEKVSFDRVFLVDHGKDVTIGAPAIDGAAVEATVVKHLKGDKVIVFKKKRRKGYQKKNGHRQYLTQLTIEDIVLRGGANKKKATPKKEEEPTAKKAETPEEVKELTEKVADKPAEEKEANKTTRKPMDKGDNLAKI